MLIYATRVSQEKGLDVVRRMREAAMDTPTTATTKYLSPSWCVLPHVGAEEGDVCAERTLALRVCALYSLLLNRLVVLHLKCCGCCCGCCGGCGLTNYTCLWKRKTPPERFLICSCIPAYVYS